MNLKLSEHRTALTNLGVTFNALDKINELIKFYSVDKPGPTYVMFDHVNHIISPTDYVQIHRDIMVDALNKQRDILIEYLAKLGIEA